MAPWIPWLSQVSAHSMLSLLPLLTGWIIWEQCRPATQSLQLRVSLENNVERALPRGGEDYLRVQLMENISGICFHSKARFAGIELIERTGIRPYIDLAPLDVLRWNLALQGSVGKAVRKNSLTDRVRNFPRF